MQTQPSYKDNVNRPTIKDFHAWFLQCFDNDAGQKVIEHLDKYSHLNFPNYDNVNATYSKVGEQTLVAYIKGVVEIAKKGDKKRANT
jgi:hypothetical protein